MDRKADRPIDGFFGSNRFLSNFYPAEVKVGHVAGFEGPATFPTVEHAYQACKTNCPRERAAFLLVKTPGDAKRLGRRVTIRADWDDVKLAVMEVLLVQKFSNPELGRKLLATGDRHLIEVNSWGDRFWGVCEGKGENHLGRLLMETRSKLREWVRNQRAAG